MRKIITEEKIIAVERHIKGGESFQKIAKSLGVGKTTVRDWCRNYKSMGRSALVKRPNNHYSLEFKVQAVEYYLAGKDSLPGTCKKFLITSTHVLRCWISLYNSHEIKESPGGRSIIMTKGRKTTSDERVSIVEDCLKNGLKYVEVSEKYGISYQQAYQWVHKYKENGVDGLIDRRGHTRPIEEMDDIQKLKAENRLLKAQLERKELENIFLKKLDEIERRRG